MQRPVIVINSTVCCCACVRNVIFDMAISPLGALMYCQNRSHNLYSVLEYKLVFLEVLYKSCVLLREKKTRKPCFYKVTGYGAIIIQF